MSDYDWTRDAFGERGIRSGGWRFERQGDVWAVTRETRNGTTKAPPVLMTPEEARNLLRWTRRGKDNT